jgi:O-antigen ligase
VTSIFWSKSTNYWLYFSNIYLNQFVFFALVSILAYKTIDIRLLRITFIITAFLSSIYLIVSPVAFSETGGRRTIYIFSNYFDPNIVGAVISIGFLICLYKLLSTYKISYFIMSFVIFYGILLTGSRGSVGSVILSTTFTLIYGLIRNKKYLYLFSLFVLGFILFININNLLLLLPLDLQNRFGLDSFLEITELNLNEHSRSTIWFYFGGLFVQAPVFGYGSGSFLPTLASVYRLSGAHNIYILVLLEFGIVGFLLFFTPVLFLLFHFFKRNNYEGLLILFGILSINFFLDGLQYKYFWIALMYLYILLNRDTILFKKTLNV